MGNEEFLPTIRSSQDNDDDLQALDEYERSMHKTLEVVHALEVEDTKSKQKAADALDYLATLVKAMEAIVERFRKPAYIYYQGVLAQKRALLGPPKEAMDLLKAKVSEYDRRVEKKLADAKLGLLLGEEGADEALHRATEAQEAEVEGLATRTYWKAECVDLKSLCAAVAKGVAPEGLVCYNEAHGNNIAKRLRSAMQYPGVRVYKEKVTVRSKR